MALPATAVDPLVKLLRWTDEVREKLVVAIRDVPPTLRMEAFSRQLAPKIGVPEDDLSEIFTALAGMYLALEQSPLPPESFANWITHDLQQQEAEESGNWEGFKRCITAIITSPNAFTLTAKALEVFTAHEKLFSSARILTDLRPVFGSDPATGAAAAVVSHMLQITYREDSELRDMFLAIDMNDIINLESALARARLKERSIRDMCKTSGLPVLNEYYEG
jgi:hypothetical protein